MQSMVNKNEVQDKPTEHFITMVIENEVSDAKENTSFQHASVIENEVQDAKESTSFQHASVIENERRTLYNNRLFANRLFGQKASRTNSTSHRHVIFFTP